MAEMAGHYPSENVEHCGAVSASHTFTLTVVKKPHADDCHVCLPFVRVDITDLHRHVNVKYLCFHHVGAFKNYFLQQ